MDNNKQELNKEILRHIYFYIVSTENMALKSPHTIPDKDTIKKICDFIMSSVQKEMDS